MFLDLPTFLYPVLVVIYMTSFIGQGILSWLIIRVIQTKYFPKDIDNKELHIKLILGQLEEQKKINASTNESNLKLLAMLAEKLARE